MPSAIRELHPLQDGEHSTETIPSHPLGVRPLGNQYLHSGKVARTSLRLLGLLPDELLVTVLEGLEAPSLRKLGATCKFLYALCHAEELWKALFLETPQVNNASVKWRGSWRTTTLGLPVEDEPKIDCSNVFSDVLHRPFACQNIDLTRFTTAIPKGNQICRFENLEYSDYAASWTEKPFILTRCIQQWPVLSQWTIDSLLEKYADTTFRAEAVDWKLSTYCDYMKRHQDESPLYLFDRRFAEKMGIEVGSHPTAAYWRPECFGPDLFEVLGQERPAHRWLIMGPRNSGSTFHKDPNGTSAWNAVIQGSKYWIMFPPAAQVPGVFVSQDSSEVTSPLSIAEWLLTFHEEARLLPECIEGVCRAGEILHVPSGWWHLVVNLEDGIALTQNFVPQSPSLTLLSNVLEFLREKADQVSGFSPEVKDPYGLFADRLGAQYPGLLQRGLELVDQKAGKKRKWDARVGEEAEGGSSGFSFGFGGDDVEDEVP